MTVSARPAIAIVGASALFPGSTDAGGFWKNILNGKDLITDVPPSHWLVEDYYDPDPSVPDKTYAKRGAFLPDVDFDAMGWGVPPNIVPETDTSQLLALIVAQKVLEDAANGSMDRLDRSRISVILGVTSGQELLGSMVSRLQRPVWTKALREAGLPENEIDDLCNRIASHYTPWKESTFPGLLGNVVAGRIANRLNLGGTNCVTDAACASAISSLSMAVNELYLGDSDMVISGGVDTMNDIFMYMCFSKTPALSATGDCRPFSDQADGTMLGEGIGMVALKRLEDAERDGDRVYAVIRGIGSSSDGRAKSVYAPLAQGQGRALRRAYQLAGYGPDSVELIEAHGTGTVAGDAAEFEGLSSVFNDSGRQDRQWCALGSIKSQIGHTKAAAGAAGLLKAVFALQHRVLPPTIKVDRPNPDLDLENSPFEVTTRARPWVRSSDHPRRASVSSFGFGGSNFHLALEEYGSGAAPSGRAPRLRAAGEELVVLHAESVSRLVETAREHLAASDEPGFLGWLAAESQTHFDPLAPARLAVVAEDESDLKRKLQQAADKLGSGSTSGFASPSGIFFGAGSPEGKIAFLFPGQGSQYIDMASAAAMHFDCALEPWDLASNVTWENTRLHQVVFPRTAFTDEELEKQRSRLTDTRWAQPAIGCTSLSLLAILRRLKVRPDCLAGHSFGEITALCVAGVIEPKSLLSVARRRGELMAAAAVTPGSMIAVSQSIEETRRQVEEWGIDVVVANHNGPDQVVLSGGTAAIEEFQTRSSSAGVQTRRLEVATAFHSPIVSSAAANFEQFLEEIPFENPQQAVYSNTTAREHSDDGAEIRRQVARQLASPVRFVEMIEAMYSDGVRTFIEVGPGAVLSALVGAILDGRSHSAVALDRKGAPGLRTLLQGIGRLAAEGHALDLKQLWEEYQTPANPHDRPRPKLVLSLNGSNYGKPYPPPGGAGELPLPNPPRRSERARPTPDSGVVESAPVSAPAENSPAARATEAGLSPASRLPVEPSPLTSSIQPNADWARAYEEASRQTSETHLAYLKTMAESHESFLRTVEVGFQSLGGGLSPQAPGIVTEPPEKAAVRQSEPAAGPPAQEIRRPEPASPVVAAEPASSAAAVVKDVPVREEQSAQDMHRVMLDIVSEKTGYPTEMLTLEMELEGDLGIDSIKRVEILSAMQDRVPGLPQVDTSVMAQLQTLGQIVEYMETQIEGSVAVNLADSAGSGQVPETPPGVDLYEIMMEIVSEKTGYPPEMLTLEMELEGDLGIDSIKRVEILSAMQDRVPGLPQVDTSVMAQLQTLGQIVEYMSSQVAADPATPAEPKPVERQESPATSTAASPELHDVMLEIVSEKTGYPTEMLSMEMELEGDLGIDSIKRVEILSAMQDRVPGLPQVDTSEMAKLQTLGQIADYMNGQSGVPLQAVAEEVASPTVEDLPVDASDRLGRFVLEAVEQRPHGMAQRGIQGEGKVIVTDEGTGVAQALVEILGSRGFQAEVSSKIPDSALRGVIFLGALRPFSSIQEAVAVNKEAFAVARAAADTLATDEEAAGFFVTVQDTGGSFGIENSDALGAWASGTAGLARTVAQEWPGVAVKAIDLQRGDRTVQEVAAAVAEEVLTGGPEGDVGLPADGRRLVLRDRAVPLTPSREAAVVLEEGDVVVASGGARGVTSATLVALATARKLRFVLLGRTEIQPEPAEIRGIEDDAALKRALLQRAQAAGQKYTPADLDRDARRVKAGREIEATLAALRSSGSEARYLPVNVTDPKALSESLQQIRQEWGGVAAVVHAAGVIHDRLVGQKTVAQFDQVFNTKVEGLRALLDVTAEDNLKVLCLFSSVAARCGNLGQSDYAMANEVLNKVARAEAARRGRQCIVKALGWGPWAGGMVGPELKARFETMGVPLIPLKEGAAMFVNELVTNSAEPVPHPEIILGGEPRLEALLPGDQPKVLSFDVQVARDSHPYLADHSIRSIPVVPVVLAIEWFARAVRAMEPDLQLAAFRELKVLRGIPLPDFGTRPTPLVVRCREVSKGSGATIFLELTDAAGKPHYTCTADLVASRDRSTNGSFPSAADLVLEAWGDRVVYDGEVLFHGPQFQMIRSIEGLSDRGIAAQMDGIADLGWFKNGNGNGHRDAAATGAPNGERWYTDSVALDGGLQLAVLWSKHMLGLASLPTGIAVVRTWTDEPPDGPIECTLSGRKASGKKAISDIVFRDRHGRIFAEFEGVETHLLPEMAPVVQRTES